MTTRKNTARAAGMTQISISMSKDLMDRIKQAAKADNRNRSNFITNVMEGWLSSHGFSPSTGKVGQ